MVKPLSRKEIDKSVGEINLNLEGLTDLTRVMAWFEGKEKKSTRISHFGRLKETG